MGMDEAITSLEMLQQVAIASIPHFTKETARGRKRQKRRTRSMQDKINRCGDEFMSIIASA